MAAARGYATDCSSSGSRSSARSAGSFCICRGPRRSARHGSASPSHSAHVPDSPSVPPHQAPSGTRRTVSRRSCRHSGSPRPAIAPWLAPQPPRSPHMTMAKPCSSSRHALSIPCGRQGDWSQHGKPCRWRGTRQRTAREGQVGPCGRGDWSQHGKPCRWRGTRQRTARESGRAGQGGGEVRRYRGSRVMPAEGRDLRWKRWRKGAGSREWPNGLSPRR